MASPQPMAAANFLRAAEELARVAGEKESSAAALAGMTVELRHIHSGIDHLVAATDAAEVAAAVRSKQAAADAAKIAVAIADLSKAAQASARTARAQCISWALANAEIGQFEYKQRPIEAHRRIETVKSADVVRTVLMSFNRSVGVYIEGFIGTVSFEQHSSQSYYHDVQGKAAQDAKNQAMDDTAAAAFNVKLCTQLHSLLGFLPTVSKEVNGKFAIFAPAI